MKRAGSMNECHEMSAVWRGARMHRQADLHNRVLHYTNKTKQKKVKSYTGFWCCAGSKKAFISISFHLCKIKSFFFLLFGIGTKPDANITHEECMQILCAFRCNGPMMKTFRGADSSHNQAVVLQQSFKYGPIFYVNVEKIVHFLNGPWAT